LAGVGAGGVGVVFARHGGWCGVDVVWCGCGVLACMGLEWWEVWGVSFLLSSGGDVEMFLFLVGFADHDARTRNSLSFGSTG
jgi:hypothetical protein